MLIYFSILIYSLLFVNFSNTAEIQKKDFFLLEAKDKEGGLSSQFLKKIYEVFQPNYFIETGTFLGHTALKASEFFNVHTIELEKKLYNRAKKVLKSKSNITVHHGDSSKILGNIISQLNGKIVFWLDGHYSGLHDGHQTALGDCNPLLKELDFIKKYNHTNSIILIDDIRLSDEILTNVKDPVVAGYPSIDDMCKKILEINKDYRFIIYGDILLAYPNDPAINTSLILQACTHSRLYNGKNIDDNFVLEMEKIISKANGQEKLALETLNNTFGSDLHAINYNVARHYILWYALMMINEKNYEKAYDRLQHIESLGFKHWRIHWYMAQAAFGLKNIKLGNWHKAQVAFALKKQNISSEIIKKLSDELPTNIISRSINEDMMFDNE